jgi:hypothetical protein
MTCPNCAHVRAALLELVESINGERLARELDLERHPERSQRITEAVHRSQNALFVATQVLAETEGGES